MKTIILFCLYFMFCLSPSAALAQKASKLLPQEKVSLDTPRKIMETLSGESIKGSALSKANIYLKVVAGGSDVTRTDDEVSLEPYTPEKLDITPTNIQPKMMTFSVDHYEFPDPYQYCMSARFSVGNEGSQKAYIWLFEDRIYQHHGYKLTMDVKNDLLTVVEYDLNGNIIKTYEQSSYDLVPDRTYIFGAFYNYLSGFFNFEIFQTQDAYISYDFGKSLDLPIFLSCFEDFGPPVYPQTLSFSIGAEADSKVKVWDWSAYITHNEE